MGCNEDMFKEWKRHCVVEFGALENFLPRLYEQRHLLENKPVSEWILDYDALSDDSAQDLPMQTQSYDPSLVDKRMEDYMKSNDTLDFLRTTQALGNKYYKSEDYARILY